MQHFGFSMLWFWVAYIIVTLIGILHTIFNIYVLHMKPMDKESMGEGYEKTKPWHPLYNIIIFTMFGFVYMNGLTNPTIGEACHLNWDIAMEVNTGIKVMQLKHYK